jgi:predicted lipoprotein with Yx(FWY)xxD motif
MAPKPSTTKVTTGVADLKVVTTPFGKAIGQGEGKVVYAWDKEADGKVACVDEACLMKWPPLLATEVKVSGDLDAKMFSIIARPDGTKQVALKGKPLYMMAIDEPGEANCQSVEGWWIQNPDGTKNSTVDVVTP